MRRLRCCSNAHVTLGGRPERGRSSKPWGPSCAKRCTHFLRAELAKWKVAETVLTWWPATTSRTACARRKTRASWVCFSTVSKVGSAFSVKRLLRGRIALLLGNEGHSSHTGHSEHSGYALNFPGSAFPPQRRSSMTSLVVTMLAPAVSTRTVTLAGIVYRLR